MLFVGVPLMRFVQEVDHSEMEEIAYRGSQLRTVGWAVSDHRVRIARWDQRTVVIEMLPPLLVLASQEV